MRHDSLSAQWAGGLRDGYPAGEPCWIDTTQPDPQAAQRFYAAAGAPPGFTDAMAWLQPAPSGAQAHWSLTLCVADADAVAARTTQLGGGG